MKYYDISLSLNNDIVHWPTHIKPEISIEKDISNGDTSNIKRININSHTGTHIDSPYHIISNGSTIDDITIDILIGKVQVIEILDPVLISKNEVESKLNLEIKRVLFKTVNSQYINKNEFNKHYVYFDKELVDYLIIHEIRLVGIDYLSVDSYFNTNKINHKLLLINNVVIIECINLFNISPGIYQMIALPLKIEKGDGAPARVILYDDI